jgi:hypothetical protein
MCVSRMNIKSHPQFKGVTLQASASNDSLFQKKSASNVSKTISYRVNPLAETLKDNVTLRVFISTPGTKGFSKLSAVSRTFRARNSQRLFQQRLSIFVSRIAIPRRRQETRRRPSSPAQTLPRGAASTLFTGQTVGSRNRVGV